jgi:NADH:ubiquinone oxidoreductase subunit E
MALPPGLGVVKGMLLGLVRFFQPKITVQYPEQQTEIAPRHRGRLYLLYDEYGALKCETCFQCAQACPIECIDMGGVDTKNRYHVHWGPAEQYAERREDSPLRRSGRTVPDRTFAAWESTDLAPLDAILDAHDHDPRRMVGILEATQGRYGFLPVAAIKHISSATGAWYSEVYGIASFYEHLRLEPPTTHVVGACRCPLCAMRGGGRVIDALELALGTPIGGTTPDGHVRLEAVDCHGEATDGPRVTVDGVVQPRVTPESATGIAQRLQGLAPVTGRA